jgi:hypothetical protein
MKNERGAVAVFLALTMLLLIGVAAVALDLARGWNERRIDQTAADLAAVAGALSYDTNQATIADEVMSSVSANLANPPSATEWQDCVGPPPSGFAAINHSTLGQIECIGINPSFLWVKLPERSVETTFAKVIGFDTITTGAEATVTLLSGGGSGALPFAIRGNSGSGEVCLDTGTSGHAEEPCTGSESGKFGNIAPPLFGNEALGTSPECAHQTSANNYVADSIAMGIDHVLWPFDEAFWIATGWNPDDAPHKQSVIDDTNTQLDECVDTGGSVAAPADGIPINTVWVDTGNSMKADVTEGMMTGTNFADGDDARLTRSSNTRSVQGYALDNNALWKYLGAASSGTNPEDSHFITECDGPTIRALATIDEKNEAMRLCLESYPTSGGPQIFSDAILESPRLGAAPRLWYNNLGGGLKPHPIQTFDLVFIHGLWFKNALDTPFFPDDGTALYTKGKKEIEQVTAHLLLDSMVSDEVHTALGGFSNDSWIPEIYQ